MQSSTKENENCIAAQRWSCPSDPLKDQDSQAGISRVKDPSGHCPGLAPIAWRIPAMAMTWHDLDDIGSMFSALEIPADHSHEKSVDSVAHHMPTGSNWTTALPQMLPNYILCLAMRPNLKGRKENVILLTHQHLYTVACHGLKVESLTSTPYATVHRRITNSTGLRSRPVETPWAGYVVAKAP